MASSDPIYSHRCSLPDRTLWFGQASLYEDRINVRGWTWRGRYERTVEVDTIDEVEWRPQPERPNLLLHLTDGSTVFLRLRKGAGLWNAKLHALLGQSVLDKHSLPPPNGRAEKGEDQEDSEDEKAT